ncbi:MAG: hypothetical protein NTV63_02660 [Candidatus Woesearchaeota archaeon]|nr:hypothetical protein [Candidatus Woesearchaeota archaeon]
MAEEPLEKNAAAKRQIARKIRIKTILEEKYEKNEGWNPNFIVISDKEKIARVNVIGIVISNEAENSGNVAYRNVVIDDGTGRISIKNFENPDSLSNMGISDLVLVIGKPREYGSERYILPEIVRKIENADWIEERNLEMELIAKKGGVSYENPVQKKGEEIVAEEIIEKAEEKKGNSEMVYELIKKMDSGNGADYDEVIKKADISEADRIIENLLKNGEIFEIKAGKLKIL